MLVESGQSKECVAKIAERCVSDFETYGGNFMGYYYT